MTRMMRLEASGQGCCRIPLWMRTRARWITITVTIRDNLRHPPEPLKKGANAATTSVVDYARSFMSPFSMKEFPVSTRYTAEELKQLDATAKQCKISRAELIHARSLGKIVTTHELADWAESELANTRSKKGRHASRAA